MSHDTVATDDDDKADSPAASGKREKKWGEREEINFTGIFLVENKECLRIEIVPRHAKKKKKKKKVKIIDFDDRNNFES